MNPFAASQTIPADAPRTRPPIRWVIAVLLLLLSMLNYIDRQALSILATTIQEQLHLSDRDYARVGQAFLLCYTSAYFLNGRIVDRFGARIGETAFVAWWSIANMLTAFAGGFWSLVAFRSLLGLGEPGHYAVSAKVVGVWFPPREKGIAAGLYTMGGTLGAAVAAPLVAWLTLEYGWQAAFIATGALGLSLAAVWWFVYRDPAAHPWLGAHESAYLGEHGLLETVPVKLAPTALSTLLTWKPIWLILAARMLTDPVWYFYLVWFAKYLQEIRKLSLAEVGATLWVVFVAADLGCLGAGWISGRLIKSGMSAPRARLWVIAGAAVVMTFSFSIPLTPGVYGPLALASLMACAVMMFMTGCVTLPLDLFPKSALGSAQGIIGMGGSIGGFISTGLIGWLLTDFRSYDAIFVAMSFLHPSAAILLWVFLPRFLRTFDPHR